MRYPLRMPRALLALAVLLLVHAVQTTARACAPAPREGQIVRIADEEALIAWDASKKLQHFVRRASFRSSADAFGFLVPTPSKPELGEVDARIFVDLAQNLVPRVVYEDGGIALEPGCTLLAMRGLDGSAPASASAGAAPAVRVLDEKRVAGFDAVVLAADDPAALSAWLKEKGFAEGPTLTEWLRPYVENKWILTAFKVAEPAAGDATKAGPRDIGTSAVRMSFTTDRPFYPYREPADQRETLQASHRELDTGRRLLRVYFASDEKYEGALGDGKPFAGAIKLADWVDVAVSGKELLGARTFLTVFDDTSSPRPGTDDVFFTRAKDPAVVTIPPTVVQRPNRVFIPLDLVAVLFGAAAGIVLLVRRSRRGSA